MPKITKHKESFTIRAREVQSNGFASIPAICGLFQEVAGNHALKLNFDITQLQAKNLTWVLHRLNVRMNRYPEWREDIVVETWPAAGDALRAFRDYTITDADGIVIGICLSYWMMINLQTRKPARMPKEVLALRLNNAEHVMDIKSNRLSPIQNIDAEKHFHVRSSDLDMNLHLNNTIYLEWMLETLPTELQYQVVEVDIVFTKECLYEEEVRSIVEIISEKESHHQLLNQDGETIALATFLFN